MFSTHRLAGGLLLAMLAAWSLLLIVTIAQLRLADNEAGRVVVLFPPAWEAQTQFEKTLLAGGVMVGQTPLASLWVVYSDQPGFVGRLKAQGAWTAFKPTPFAALTLGSCFAAPGMSTQTYPTVRRSVGGYP